MRLRRASGFAVTLGLLTATVALAPSTAGAGGTPLWVKHVRNYPGGISGAVRARLIAIESERFQLPRLPRCSRSPEPTSR